MVAIVLPTRNESAIIRATLEQLLAFLHTHIHEDWHVVVADNGSTDDTRTIVRDVVTHEPRVELLEIPDPGKGLAVLTAWTRARTPADSLQLTPDAFAFMDADLATDLRHLPELIAAIRNGADVAIGSRYAPLSSTQRGMSRRLVSWCYRKLLRLLFGLRITDPPCGFKAVNARVIQEVVPLVRDRQWFFDTELLIRAQVAGMCIAEIPVTWHEPRRGRSFTKVLHIILHDLRAMIRLLCERRS
ncbi:MAG: glycosyltransferase [bacterium]|nr:glycosyltransferase [bacterium]